MIALPLREIAGLVGGTVADASGTEQVTGPAFVDSRAVEPGGLFVAVPGERVDGHDFAAPAVVAGAAGGVGGGPPPGPPPVVAPPPPAPGLLPRPPVGTPPPPVLAPPRSPGNTRAQD